MSKTKESLSPSGSISKATGQIHRTPSRESLNAHPLLANAPTLPPTSSNSSLKTESVPKYVPYTPRHRVPTSSATIGTSNQPASSLPAHQPGHGNATSILHMQNMKATAQSIGIGTGSVGWAILEKLTDAESGAEWDEIWSALVTLKPVLLLPLEPYGGEVITPELVKDHIAFWGSLNPSFVTYSGLIGILESGTLTFQSSMDINSAAFVNLLKPDHQNSVLSSLPPLPIFKHDTHPLPSFAIPENAVLQIHPRPNKPPLPPRPSTSSTKSYGGRIANPFASLFGRPSPSPSTNRPASPSPSISSFTDELSSQHQSCMEVRAYSVGKKIVKSLILSDLVKTYKKELKARLQRCPQWVKKRVENFVMPFLQHEEDSGHLNRRRKSTASLLSSSMDGNALSNAFQSLYETMKEDIRRRAIYSDEGSDNGSSFGSDIDDEKLSSILDDVEEALCELFYDRLFCPVAGDDLSHDDALASRIAGLNMLDLGLQHLGVDLPNKKVEESALKVVKKCGAILQKLDDVNYRSPAKKASLLVEAHKSVVDGLSRLPKLRLKPEGETADLQPPSIIIEQQHGPTSASFTTPEMVITEFSDMKVDGKGQSNKSDLENGVESLNIPQESREVIEHDETEEDKPESTTTVSGDILFPFLIYAVVKANPPHIVSHILFTERFRSPNAKGEEKYCIINLMAVVEFLEHVDMAALGLGDSDRIMSIGDLSPITLTRDPVDPTLTKILGKRVNQQVGELAELAGSAGKMVTGVVDTSFGVLRGFLGSHPDSISQTDTTEITPWNMVKPSFGLLRRVSIGRPKTPSGGHEEEGRQLVEVNSRPSSIRGSDANDDDDEAEDTSEEDEPGFDTRDTRSIRSFSSMMSKESRAERATLADRLAKMSANVKIREAKPSPPVSRPTSMLLAESIIPPGLSVRSKFPPPNQRFLECDEHDLRISEISELLQEYRRVVQAMRSAGLFEEQQ